MRAPQIIMVIQLALSLGAMLILHGKPKEGKYNFWSTIVSVGAYVALLWWGGFFG